MLNSSTVDAAWPAGTGEVCNIPSLVERCMGAADFAATLLTMFAKGLPEKVEKIHSSLDGCRWEEAAALVHGLKGEAANLELTDIRQAIVALEDAVQANEQQRLPQLAQALKSAAQEFHDAYPTLQQHLAQLP